MSSALSETHESFLFMMYDLSFGSTVREAHNFMNDTTDDSKCNGLEQYHDINL